MEDIESRECTFRACLAGALIGVVLAAGNVYTGLKAGFIDGGAITAALLAHAMLHRKNSVFPFTPLENNVAQATAASAAVMGGVAGLLGPTASLELMGIQVPAGIMLIWAVGIGLCGSVVAVAMRKRWIDDEKLPFPSGAATARVIRSAFALHDSARSRIWIILGAASFAMLITELRDGVYLIPASIWAPATLAGVAVSQAGLGFSLSPLMVSTGCLIGLRGALAMGVGSIVGWYIIMPRLVAEGAIEEASFSAGVAWLVWPAAAMMITAAVVGLLLDWRRGVRVIADMASHARSESSADAASCPPEAADTPARRPSQLSWIVAVIWLLGLTMVVSLLLSFFAFDGVDALLICALAVILVVVCGRAVGETDFGPVGAVSAIGQAGFGASGPVGALGASAAPQGMASSTAQLLWSFKAGKVLGSSPKALLFGHLIGIGVGAVVAIATYRLLSQVYVMGSDAMPAPGVTSALATARALSGTVNLPAHAGMASAIAAGFALVCVLVSRYGGTWAANWVPSPIALGVALVMPANAIAAIVFGALLLSVVPHISDAWTEEDIMTAAAGGLAGESLMAVALAAFIAAGI